MNLTNAICSMCLAANMSSNDPIVITRKDNAEFPALYPVGHYRGEEIVNKMTYTSLIVPAGDLVNYADLYSPDTYYYWINGRNNRIAIYGVTIIEGSLVCETHAYQLIQSDLNRPSHHRWGKR